MIIGAHAIIYSKDSEADRRFFQDVLGLNHIDAGAGWLIFGLPPAEVAVHPSKTSVAHELYLMTDDVAALAATLKKRGVPHTAPVDQRWGIIMHVTLPSGGKLAIYEPRHERPAGVVVAPAAKAVSPAKPLEKTKEAAAPKPSATKASSVKAATVKAAPAKAAAAKAPLADAGSSSKKPTKRR
jgi:hypothetical protein